MHNTESRLRDGQIVQDPNSLGIKIKKKSKLPVAKKSNRQRFKPVEATSQPKLKPKPSQSFINLQKQKSPVQLRTPPSRKLVLGAVRQQQANHNTNSYSSKSLSRSFTHIPCTSPEETIVPEKLNEMHNRQQGASVENLQFQMPSKLIMQTKHIKIGKQPG